MKIILIIPYSVWPKGCTFIYVEGMYKECKGRMVGISSLKMQYLLKVGIAEYVTKQV